MDIKELIKYQMVSRMGSQQQTNSNTTFSQMFIQIFMFLFMALIDDISKAIPKICNDIKSQFTSYCTEKVKETIDHRPKQLIDNSVTLSTRHEVSIFNMVRVFVNSNSSSSSSSSSSSKQEEGSEESNGMVDALINHVSKLNNIPILKLINKGQIMMTYKDKPIQVTKDIFLKIDSIDISATGSVNSIKLSLLSNTLPSAELAFYVKDLYTAHLQEIKNSLGDKIYYFDQKSQHSQPPPLPVSQDASAIQNHKRMIISTSPKQLSFTMSPFYSNKKFSNIYGDEVRLIEKRVNFFMDNKDWYDSKGIPYQIGLLLSGMPGAGKTSIIRAIANLTRRHIVNVNFANITTATQLKNLFYSDKIQVYKDTSLSELQSYFIPVDQRIYVLEEIDAIGDIVKQRTNDDTKSSVNDELTLMEILTVLDGTMEIPGRIVIMTSNHPEVLDSALIRPGRIDVKVHFGYSKKELIAEMYGAYFDQPFPSSEIHRLPDKLLSPAEVGQVLFKHFDNVNYENIIADLNETAQSLGRIAPPSEPDPQPHPPQTEAELLPEPDPQPPQPQTEAELPPEPDPQPPQPQNEAELPPEPDPPPPQTEAELPPEPEPHPSQTESELPPEPDPQPPQPQTESELPPNPFPPEPLPPRSQLSKSDYTDTFQDKLDKDKKPSDLPLDSELMKFYTNEIIINKNEFKNGIEAFNMDSRFDLYELIEP
jgi:DNA replication protein DnaC